MTIRHYLKYNVDSEYPVSAKTNLKLGEKSFKFRASALWNGLNINIKNADNIDVFKQRLMIDLKCDSYKCDKFCIDLPKYYNE